MGKVMTAASTKTGTRFRYPAQGRARVLLRRHLHGDVHESLEAAPASERRYYHDAYDLFVDAAMLLNAYARAPDPDAANRARVDWSRVTLAAAPRSWVYQGVLYETYRPDSADTTNIVLNPAEADRP